jgi:hypothetical protein
MMFEFRESCLVIPILFFGLEQHFTRMFHFQSWNSISLRCLFSKLEQHFTKMFHFRSRFLNIYTLIILIIDIYVNIRCVDCSDLRV